MVWLGWEVSTGGHRLMELTQGQPGPLAGFPGFLGQGGEPGGHPSHERVAVALGECLHFGDGWDDGHRVVQTESDQPGTPRFDALLQCCQLGQTKGPA